MISTMCEGIHNRDGRTMDADVNKWTSAGRRWSCISEADRTNRLGQLLSAWWNIMFSGCSHFRTSRYVNLLIIYSFIYLQPRPARNSSKYSVFTQSTPDSLSAGRDAQYDRQLRISINYGLNRHCHEGFCNASNKGILMLWLLHTHKMFCSNMIWIPSGKIWLCLQLKAQV